MGKKRILLMHFSSTTGHYKASLAIEEALKDLDCTLEIQNIDILNLGNSFLGRGIYHLYLFIVTILPFLWSYLYDNEQVMKRTAGIRRLAHRLTTQRIEQLLEGFRPDAVVCTQAFPCALVAEYKKRHNSKLPLIAVLTDYTVHSYWLNDAVDIYVIPHNKIAELLMQRGIPSSRQKILGIPIDQKFARVLKPQQILQGLKLDPQISVILIMGGGQGIGPIKKIVQTLNRLTQPVQLIVVCGTNIKLYKWLVKNRVHFAVPVLCFGYAENIDELMGISAFIVTKPGGVTSAEALSKSLPIISVNSLPGQESRNMQFLLSSGAALKADSFQQLKSLTQELLNNPSRLRQLRNNARNLAYPDSAEKIAQLILSRIDNAVSSL